VIDQHEANKKFNDELDAIDLKITSIHWPRFLDGSGGVMGEPRTRSRSQAIWMSSTATRPVWWMRLMRFLKGLRHGPGVQQ
jgi:hypothetical protein